MPTVEPDVRPFVTMLDSLPVRPEVSRGYSRDAFDDWQTQRDGCDTREVVLIREAIGREPTRLRGAGRDVVVVPRRAAHAQSLALRH